MGMRVVWVAFGAATCYIIGAILIPMIVVYLRHRGTEIEDSLAWNLTRLGAALMAALGGVWGLRHARKLEARRDKS